MGTRSLTFIYDENDTPILNMYRQFDGYPSGHGAELAEFLAGLKLVNGFGNNGKGLANGMGCLAAQMIAHFKDGVGGFYIHSVLETDLGQDYEYHVYEDRVEVRGPGSIFNPGPNDNLFKGSWAKFHKFCKNPVVQQG